MDARRSVTLHPGRGLGDANGSRTRQVTVVSRERWEAIAERMGEFVDPVLRRANLLVSGVDLAYSRGRVLCIGRCRLEVRGETRPCERMDAQLPGLRAELAPHWGGGIYASVLDGGPIAIGDAVDWEAAATAALPSSPQTRSRSG